MSVSFIINSSGKPKELYDMSDSEINNLSTLLLGPINNLNKSRVSVIKNRENPIKLSDLSVDSLAVLKASVNSYKNGRIKEVHMFPHNDRAFGKPPYTDGAIVVQNVLGLRTGLSRKPHVAILCGIADCCAAKSNIALTFCCCSAQ